MKSLRRSMPTQDVHLCDLFLLLRLEFVDSLEILELSDSRKRATTVHTSQYHHMPECYTRRLKRHLPTW